MSTEVVDYEVNERKDILKHGYIDAYTIKWSYGKGIRENAIENIMKEHRVKTKTFTMQDFRDEPINAFESDKAENLILLILSTSEKLGELQRKSPHYSKNFYLDKRFI